MDKEGARSTLFCLLTDAHSKQARTRDQNLLIINNYFASLKRIGKFPYFTVHDELHGT